METNEKTAHKNEINNEELEQFIFIDSLTKLPNFNYFKDVFDRKWRSAVRKQEPISLVFFDLDHLGLYNEHYGVQAGDKLLKKVAEKVKSMLNRPEDFLSRYGEGRFIIVLPETNMNGALQVAETIRETIEALQIPHDQSTTSDVVTISFGVGTKIPFVWEDPFNFVKAVEQALYRAKRSGRNQGIWNNVFEEEDIE
ncbi:MAG TPA: GGDEF domain-containing protein [Bacillus bacterium]|nr:GGDEF domain-containing protein [Bacillus sp. (in: firmicutes)]